MESPCSIKREKAKIDINNNVKHFNEMKNDAKEFVQKTENSSSFVYFVEQESRSTDLFFDDEANNYNEQFYGINKENFSEDQEITIDNNLDGMKVRKTIVYVFAAITVFSFLAAIVFFVKYVMGRKREISGNEYKVKM